MDLFFYTLRKFLVGITTLVFTFAIVYVPQQYNTLVPVKTAHAQLPGGATEPTQLKNTAANIGTLANTKTAVAKETVLDGIAYHIAKTFISQMLRSTITWINSGFHGSPAFVQDLERFLLDSADLAAGEYIKGLGEVGSFICRPFRINIQIALALKYQKSREGNRVDECTLSGIVDNIDDFIDGNVAREDFWEQWIEVTSKPSTYTPYGQMLEAEAQLAIQINNERVNLLEEVNWGDGFLSSEVCESVDGPNGPEEQCVISTPGQTISESLNKALGAGQDQLVAADEINEVISALVGQIANQALTGAAGLLGLSTRGGGGRSGDSYVDALVNERQGDGNLFDDGISEVAERLDVQTEYRSLAISYIPRLLAVSTSKLASEDLKERALTSYRDAVTVRDTTATHIAFLTPLVKSYRLLETEYQTANEERKQNIRQEQSNIISRGIQYRSYTDDRLQLSEREWSDIVNQ